MSNFAANQMGKRGVSDSVSSPAIPGKHHIPWSDVQLAHSGRNSTPERLISESAGFTVSVGWSS